MLPRHIAVIMDGNGRWAKARNLPRGEGHRAGVKAARSIVSHCRDLGVGHLTMYTFSRENWSRPKDEIGLLFDLLKRFLDSEMSDLIRKDIRLTILGEMADIPFTTRQALKLAVDRSRHCKTMRLNLALNYGSRDEILRACRSLAEQAAKGGIKPRDIDEAAFSAELYTHDQPDPDLIIRTSGELRISNFLLWQAAYAEFAFTDTRWPDFTPEELDRILADYANRERRFGKTGEQVENPAGKD